MFGIFIDITVDCYTMNTKPVLKKNLRSFLNFVNYLLAVLMTLQAISPLFVINNLVIIYFLGFEVFIIRVIFLFFINKILETLI